MPIIKRPPGWRTTMLITGLSTWCLGACTPSHARRLPHTATPTTAAAAAHAPLVSVNTADDVATDGQIVTVARSLLDAVSGLRAEVTRRGGMITRERVVYAQAADMPTLRGYARSYGRNAAAFRIHLPSREVAALSQWLRQHGTIVLQEFTSAQVSSPPSEEAAEAGMGAAPQPVPAMATISVTLLEASPNQAFDDAKFTPRLRATGLVTHALDGTAGREIRRGIGMGIRLGDTELDVTGMFATTEHASGISMTVGQVLYGRTLGNGQRRALNPYMTLRTGYANLDGSAWLIGAELGVELLKTKGVLLAIGVAPTGLIGSNSQLAVEANASLGVAF